MLIQFFISLILSITFIKILMNFLKKNFLDLPNDRSSHVKPIPRGGGIVFVICGCFFSLLNGMWFPLICIPLSIGCLYDDFKGLNPIFRFIMQAITSFFLILNSSIYNTYIQTLPPIIEIFIVFLLVICGTAIMNFLNFMDGIDGILSSCMIVVLSFFAIKFLPPLWPLVGAIIGFLYFNWHPAKIFMGDSGSIFIGAVFFGCILQTATSINDFSIIFIASPLLFDAFSCLIRRFYIGENIFKPHKLHLYQRLSQSSFSHQRVTFIYMSSTILISMCYALGYKNIYLISILFVIAFGILLDKKYAFPFKKRFMLRD